MNLVAKNKIAQYIEKNPEARVDLVAWLEEYPYWQGRVEASNDKYTGCSFGSASPGGSDYLIKYTINREAKVCFITWIGTKEEIQQEYVAMPEMHPEEQHKTITVEVVVATPIPDPQGIIEWKKDDLQEVGPIWVANKRTTDEKSDLTATAYETALARATDIVEAGPETPEFYELQSLIALILNYEADQLRFPPAYTYEVIALRMNLLQLNANDVATMAGTSEDDLSLFLSGKLELPSEILQNIYKRLGLHIPLHLRYLQ